MRTHRRVLTVWSEADITGDTAAIMTTRAFSDVKESFSTKVSFEARKGMWLFWVSMALQTHAQQQWRERSSSRQRGCRYPRRARGAVGTAQHILAVM